MAMPTVVAVGAAGSGTAGVGSAQGLGLPAGILADDILVMVCESQTNSVTAPSGWAHITGSTVIVASGVLTRLNVLWRRATASETVPTLADAGNHIVARIIAVRGCVTSGNPWNATSNGTELVADTTVSITGVTTTAADCLVLAAFSTGTDVNSTAHVSAFANAALGSVTERMDNWSIVGDGGGFGLATGTKTVAGATGATTATVATANFKAFMTVALQGAASQSATATPGVVLGSTTIPGPTEGAGSTVTPAVVLGSAVIPTPVVVVPDAPAAPAVVLGSTTVPLATVQTGARPTPAVVLGSTTVPAATVRTGARPTPAQVLGSTSIPAGALSTGARPTPAVVLAVTTIPGPSVSGGSNANPTPAVVLAQVAVPAPSVATGARVDADPLEATTLIPAPTVFTAAGVNITPAVIVGSTITPAKTIRTGARPTPAVIHGAVSVGAVTIPSQRRRRTTRPTAGVTTRPRGLA